MVTVRDWVDTQKVLIDHLGIKRLLGVVGGSTGGMQVLQWVVSYPDMVRLAIPIATTSKLSAQAIAFNEVGRQAIQFDPNWREGDYYGKAVPRRGLSIARMIGHITYLSERSMHQKFGRRLQDKSEYGYDFRADFQVESYLRYKGDHFVNRFDANSYLYITKAMDYFDLTQPYGSARAGLCRGQEPVPRHLLFLRLAVPVLPVERNCQRAKEGPCRGDIYRRFRPTTGMMPFCWSRSN